MRSIFLQTTNPAALDEKAKKKLSKEMIPSVFLKSLNT